MKKIRKQPHGEHVAFIEKKEDKTFTAIVKNAEGSVVYTSTKLIDDRIDAATHARKAARMLNREKYNPSDVAEKYDT